MFAAGVMSVRGECNKCSRGNTWNKQLQPATVQSDYSISLKYGIRYLRKMTCLGSKYFRKIAKLKEDNHNSQIPTLRTESLVITADTDKATCLNNVFSSNFNTASSGITETNIGDFAVDPSIEPSEEFFVQRMMFYTFVDVRYH